MRWCINNRIRRLKTPTVLQMEASECGAASLAMILGYHGCYVALEQLRIECGISRDGSKANYILRAARLHGLIASGYQLEVASLSKVTLPAILFWEFNHFVVLEAVKGKKYYINDPASGHRTVLEEDFKRAFTGIVLEFRVGPQFQLGGEKLSAIKIAIKKLKKVPAIVFYLAVATLLSTLLSLSMPAYIQFFVDNILIQKKTDLVYALVWSFFLLGLFLGLFSVLINKVSFLFEDSLIFHSSIKFFWRLLRLPVTFFSQRYVSDLSDRMYANIQIAQVVSFGFLQLMLGLWGVIVLSIVMAFYDWKLTGICMLVFMSMMMITHILFQDQGDAQTEIVFQNSRMLSTVMSDLYNVESLKVHGSESDFLRRFIGIRYKKANAVNRLITYEAILDALPTFLLFLSFLIVLGLGSLEVFSGDLSLGMLLAFSVLAALLLQALDQLALISKSFKQLNFNQNRINDVMHYRLDPEFIKKERTDSSQKELRSISGNLRIENLTFSYDPYLKPFIENFNLDVKPGSRVAIVGASGSGKSTIARLICGLYTPLSGQILFDGISRNEIPREVLVKQLSYVEQEAYFFSASIWNNLTLWDSSIQKEDVEKATQDALIFDDIKTALDGFQGLLLENGKNLSGGERQRLEIARALISNPTILILDECMSALDPLTEKLIDERLRIRGCTCIFVAHRLSTIRDSDEIVVLDLGRVVQRGKHEQLIKEAGIYKTLVQLDG
jgi:ATP-binding cassette, subfamily C, bacterial